ncbi:hypothetical protein NM208_g14261 [Fusarium decemcellulare]|uniref:Uncharacterized protein n=1 Tax=Fusarium decemcellulare TaxID=57161 RepID=A0ACC1RGS3_9HYPO|nr:hypothetical protein NM208_g14261 [Fusarium decemcellulare]
MLANHKHCVRKLKSLNIQYSQGDGMLIWVTLDRDDGGLPDFTWDLLNFNYRFINPATGEGFLHLIVRKLMTCPYYTEERAVAHATKFTSGSVNERTRATFRNREGKTPLLVLASQPGVYPKLEMLLARAEIRDPSHGFPATHHD